jgi:hypothetical protein
MPFVSTDLNRQNTPETHEMQRNLMLLEKVQPDARIAQTLLIVRSDRPQRATNERGIVSHVPVNTRHDPIGRPHSSA